jgi:hypothetical protein
MGFKAYKVDATENGDWRLSSGLPVRFSGPNGLVAMWVRAHRDAAGQPWKASPQDWLQMLMPPAEAATHWIVFEQQEEGKMALSRLYSVSGVAARRVELMFTFTPLEITRAGAHPQVHEADNGTLWSEELALDGGPFSTDCSWRWTRPHLALGAATIRPARVPAH